MTAIIYLAHLHVIARAAGRAGRLARVVKIADLQDRCRHPRVRADGCSPPYARGLALLMDQPDPWHGAGGAAAV
jgi:hypothetical protein